MAKIIGYKKIFKPQYKVCCNNCGAIIIFDKYEVSDDYQYNEFISSFNSIKEVPKVFEE